MYREASHSTEGQHNKREVLKIREKSEDVNYIMLPWYNCRPQFVSIAKSNPRFKVTK